MLVFHETKYVGTIQCSDSFDKSMIRFPQEHYKFMLGLRIRVTCTKLITKFYVTCGRFNIVVVLLKKFVALTLNFINE